MTDELWGVGADARRAGRPVVLCAALGVAAFALTFTGALLLGRGFAGSALAALLLPIALSGAIAVGLAVAFVVAVALEQPYGVRRVGRLVKVVTPFAALVALFAYAADPGANPVVGGPAQVLEHPATSSPQPPPRRVTVPRSPTVAPPVAQPPVVRPPAPGVPGSPGSPVVVAAPRPVVVLGPVLPDPAPDPRPAVRVPTATESPDPAEVGPRRSGKRVLAAAPRIVFRAATAYSPRAHSVGKPAKHAGKHKPAKPAKAKKRGRR